MLFRCVLVVLVDLFGWDGTLGARIFCSSDIVGPFHFFFVFIKCFCDFIILWLSCFAFKCFVNLFDLFRDICFRGFAEFHDVSHQFE